MSAELIKPDQLPLWVPGELTLNNPEAGWRSVRRQSYAREVEEVRLRDALRADDPAIHRAAMVLSRCHFSRRFRRSIGFSSALI